MQSQFYKSKLEWRKLRPMILKRIKDRAKDYPVRSMVPVANDALRSRTLLTEGVSALLDVIPIKACRFCPEVFIGDQGHLIRTCRGYRRSAKNQVHRWVNGGINDILVQVEAFHLNDMFQDIIKHDQRFDFDRVPAIVELCLQAGAGIPNQDLDSGTRESDDDSRSNAHGDAQSLPHNVRQIAQRTLEAWERLRLLVEKLMLVYPVKVCEYCSEVHVGPSGHKARLCGVFKYESWRGCHFWKKACVDDLVPPKVVWHRRAQDPDVLLDTGRGFYGHAPAVVELCAQGGAIVPKKYFCTMKVNGSVGLGSRTVSQLSGMEPLHL